MIRPTIAARSAIEAYGDYEQRQIAVEELAELIVALKHYERHRVDDDAVIEEIADVCVVLSQLAVMFGHERINDRVRQKTERLMREINLVGGFTALARDER
jgi:NTP pyrophosphatase (non-canonical NTP hydrolase)